MKSYKGFTLLEFVVIIFIVALFAVVFLPKYNELRTQQMVKELVPSKTEEALLSKGKINYYYRFSSVRNISALFLSSNSRFYQGEACWIFEGSLEKQRVSGNYVVARYTPTNAGPSECSAGIVALTKENWVVIYSTYLVTSGEDVLQAEREKLADESKKEQARFAAEEKKKQEIKQKAFDFIKKEGLLDDK